MFEELVKDGRLSEALESLQAAVRGDPADATLRIGLFELFCLTGQWDRAWTQLDVVAELDSENLALTHTYQALIRCELFRREVFEGKKTPVVFGEPTPWVAKLIEALPLYASQPEVAGALRDAAFDEAQTVPGTLDGEGFQWLADMDGRLGPVLEMIINGRYYWVPMSNLSALAIEAPADLRDYVWSPATVTFANEGQTVCFVPARYSGSEDSPDEQLQSGHSTHWDDLGNDVFGGVGQRMFSTENGEVALLDVREIAFEPVA